MTEPKLLSADGLKWLRDRTRFLHAREVQLLFDHIAALQARVDAADEALRVVAAIKALSKQASHILIETPTHDRPVWNIRGPDFGDRRDSDTLLAALEQAVASKEFTNAPR